MYRCFTVFLQKGVKKARVIHRSIFSCFTFNHIEDISYGIINSIKLASCYELFNLSSTNTHLQKIADLAEKNLEATNYDFIVDENKENPYDFVLWKKT